MRRILKQMMLPAGLTLCLTAVFLMGVVKSEAATVKSGSATAKSTAAKVVLEFTDGTKETWQTGDAKISRGKRKLAYVYFGEYPQKELKGKKLTNSVRYAVYNRKNGIATMQGAHYKILTKDKTTFAYDSKVERDLWAEQFYFDWNGRKFVYFKVEPIKWRVLSVEDDTALLLSEYALDNRRYNEKNEAVTWESCTLRSWLNKTFISTAFNKKEKKLIKTTEVREAENSAYDTEDKVFLLSEDECENKKYGFTSEIYREDTNRSCSLTDYTIAMGSFAMPSYDSPIQEYYKTKDEVLVCWWWLRSPGVSDDNAAAVYGGSGAVDYDFDVNEDIAVRPAIRLDLSSIIG